MRRYLIVLAIAAVVGAGLTAAWLVSASVAEAGEGAAAAATGARQGHPAVDEVLEGLVADGVITREQAEAVAEALRDRFGGHEHGHGDAHRAHGGEGLEAIAAAIGIDEATLLDGLHDGRTIAEIAEANGSSATAVVDALMALHEEHFDDLEADGHISPERASDLSVLLREQLEAFVAGDVTSPHHGFGHGFGRGHGFDHDFGPNRVEEARISV